MITLEQLLLNCPHIPAITQYWFIRTDGGNFYPGFLQEEVVGLDYSKITMSDLNMNLEEDANIETLKTRVFQRYSPEHGQPGIILAQLLKFKNSMKNGDYVIIPGAGTKILALGQITNDEIVETEIMIKGESGEFEKKLLKTKKVKWIKQLLRSDLHPKLHLSFHSHQTIVDVTKQSEWVDSLLYDFYKKGEEFNYVIRVGRDSRIPAREAYRTLNTFIDMIEKVSHEFHLAQDVDTMATSINLNSKGPVRFISFQPSVAIIGLVLVACMGGEIVFDPANAKFQAGFKNTAGDEFVKVTDQLMKIAKFIKENDKDKNLEMKIRDLEIEAPKVVPVITGVTKKEASSKPTVKTP